MSGDQDDFDSKNELTTVPLKVVREAAMNLLIHRTWWSEARVPSVNIFDDRVEFMNPGAFPQGTKPEDFRKRPHSEPINEIIANALFKGGVSEGWGRGIQEVQMPDTRKFSKYRKAYYRYPQVAASGNAGAVMQGVIQLEVVSFANPYPYSKRRIGSLIKVP